MVNGTTYIIKLLVEVKVHRNYQLLKCEVAILLCFQLCSMGYTALQMNNSMRSASALYLEVLF